MRDSFLLQLWSWCGDRYTWCLLVLNIIEIQNFYQTKVSLNIKFERFLFWFCWTIPPICSGPNECGLVAHVCISFCYYPIKRIRSFNWVCEKRRRKARENKIFPQPQSSIDQSHKIKVFSQSNRQIIPIFGNRAQHS